MDASLPAKTSGSGTAVSTQFAKYVQVRDIVFTASADVGGQIIYTSEKTGEIVSYFAKSEENIALFFKEMRFGNYWLLKKVDKSKSQNKKYRKQWDNCVPNIYKIETFFKTHDFVPGNFKQDSNGMWAVADVVTGATIAGFEEYAKILYKADRK